MKIFSVSVEILCHLRTIYTLTIREKKSTHPTYRLLASVTMRSKILIEVLFTVKLSSFFNEALVLKRLPTSGTDKMVRVPCLANCTHKRSTETCIT